VVYLNLVLMYVCICHGITEKTIQKAARNGVTNLTQLANETGATTGCGSCAEMAENILHGQHQQPDFLAVISARKPQFV